MIRLDCSTERCGGVTLVTAVVKNDGPRRRVRVAAEGDLWPPRRRGVPERGWTDDGFEVVLEAGERRAIGYATPDEPTDPPAVVETERLAPARAGDPATAVPDIDPTPAGVVRALDDPGPPRAAVATDTAAPPEAWLDAVERRLVAAEALAAAETLDEATAAIESTGDLAAVSQLVDAVAADRAAVERVRARLTDLFERSQAVSVPVETFERLA